MEQKRLSRQTRGAKQTTAIFASPLQEGQASPTATATASASARPDMTDERVQALEARHQALVLATGHITWTARLRDGQDNKDGRDGQDKNGTDRSWDAVGWDGANRDWRLFTGQDGDAARGWGWLDAVHPDDRERTRAAWTAAVAARDAIELDCRVRRRDGEYRWLLVRGVPVVEALEADDRVDASLQEWVGTATDITERRQSEAALAADLAQELADMQQIQRISTRLLQEGHLDALYEQVLDAAIAVMHSDMGSMQMLERDQNALRLLAWRGFAPASAAFWEWVRVDAGSSCGVALHTGERVIVPDVERCDFMAGTQDLESSRLSGIRAVQSTPLVSRDGPLIGMLSTHWRTPHQPGERELRLLDVLARQAADLIERTQTETALAYLAAIVTSADDAIASKTLDGIVTSWNASAERMFGCTAQEMIGQPILRLFPPDRQNEEDLILARIRAGESVEHFETVRVTKDGRRLDVSLTISPIRDSAGTIIGASKIVRDISERKRMEAALRESDEKFRTLADNIPTLAWMAYPDGHIFWYNRRWYAYTGTTPESQVGWGWQNVHNREALPHVMDLWQRSLATGEPFEMVFPLKGADGMFRPFLTRIMPVMDEQGRVVRWFGTNVDVSDLRAAEVALRAANERMDEFLHTATHELKIPLTALQATLQLTERCLQRLPVASPDGSLDESLDRAPHASHEAVETVAQFVARSQQQVRRLARLVNDLVEAARIQMDILEIRPTPCDLAEIVWETVTAQRAVHPERTIHLQLAHGQPVLVVADAVRIGQVITNYLTNALKYSPADQPVEVTFNVEGETARTARVCVRDHGPGIPAEEQTRVWERGHRVPGIESSSEGMGMGLGLGLGLHISREIVERHVGAVGVSSVSGQGSTFWFTLPIERIERTGEQR